MTKTFTLSSENTIQKPRAVNKSESLNNQGPSDLVISNILNFSKNLEIKPSGIMKHVEYLKS